MTADIAELRRLEAEAKIRSERDFENFPGVNLSVREYALYVAMRNALPELLKALEWQPIETAPFNRTVDLWCTYADAPATWGNGRPAGSIVYGRHKSETYGWFGNQSNNGVPRGDEPDLIPVAWREPTPNIPIEMMEAFVAALPLHGGENV